MIRFFTMFALSFLMAALFITARWTVADTYSGEYQSARSLYVQGQYDSAITAALALETAEGLTLAAEVLSAKIMLGMEEDGHDSSKKARDWAEAALEKAPDMQEAHFQEALAAGFETRTSSPFRAWRKRLPQHTYDMIQTYRQTYPEDARGDALLGAWHLGIVRKIGDGNARRWFDASEGEGYKYYKSAYTKMPQDIIIGSNFAVTLLSVDIDKYKSEAETLFKAVANMPAQTAADRDIQNRLAAILPLFDDADALKLAVDDLLDGNLPEDVRNMPVDK